MHQRRVEPMQWQLRTKLAVTTRSPGPIQRRRQHRFAAPASGLVRDFCIARYFEASQELDLAGMIVLALISAHRFVLRRKLSPSFIRSSRAALSSSDRSVATCSLCPSLDNRGRHRGSGLSRRRPAGTRRRSARTELLRKTPDAAHPHCIPLMARSVVGRKRRRCQNGQGDNNARHCFQRLRLNPLRNPKTGNFLRTIFN
jgi:hypothetical protein